MLNYRLRRREPKERPPPDYDDRYEVIAEYKAGDGKRPVIPLIFKFLREGTLVKYLLILLLVLNLLLLSTLALNAWAAYELSSAQSNAAEILAGRHTPFVKAREVGVTGDARIIELTFSTGVDALDSLVWVRRVYVKVGVG